MCPPLSARVRERGAVIVDLHPCFLAALLNSPWGRISAALPPLRLESMNNKIILGDYNRGDSPLFEFRNKQRGLYVYSALFLLSSTIPSIFVEKLIRKSGKIIKEDRKSGD